MSIAFIGQTQAKQDKSDELKNFLLSVVAPALASAEGCESYRVFQSEDDPTKFIGVEIWNSVDAHRASVKQITPESITEFRTLVDDMGGGYYRIL